MDNLLEERRVAPLRTLFVVRPKRSVQVLVRAHLAEQTSMLPKVEAVVCGENNNRLVGKPHILNGFQQEAHPGVHHRDLAAVGGVPLPQLRLLVSGHVMPVPIEWEHHLAVVVRHVEFRVVGRGIPGFVRVPGVHVQEEVLLVVALQPLHGGHECLRRIPVRLVSPPGPDIQCLMVIAGLRNQRPQGVLSGVHEEGLEAPVVVHSISEVVGGVDGSRSVEAVPSQNLGQSGHTGGKRFPTHEGHRPSSSLMVCPCGHSRESGGVVSVEPDRLRRQRVKRGCANMRIAVSANVVSAEGIRNYPDDVHLSHFRMACLFRRL